jgi:phosphoserine phosphatase
MDLVLFDCDSTLSRIEGIDELARLKTMDEATAAEIARLTRLAMEGVMPLETVYAARLALLQPSRSDLQAVTARYRGTVVDDARAVIAALHALGRPVYILSGGLFEAVADFGAWLGVPRSHILAVGVYFNQLAGRWWAYWEHAERGNLEEQYLAYVHSPLSDSQGKAELARQVAGEQRATLVGDGASDLAAQGAVAQFIGFGGVVRREAVAHAAAVYIESSSLAPVLPLVTTPGDFARLHDTAHQAIFERGLALIADGQVTFRQPGRKRRLLRSFGVEDR